MFLLLLLNYSFCRSRSVEGGSLRAASHPPSQPPPQPPVPSTSVNASSPQIGWAELPPREPSASNIVPTSPILSSLPPSPDGERPTPVPAPRYCQFLILSSMKILHIIFVCVDSPSRHYPTNQKALLGEIPFTPSALHSYFHITLYSDIVLEMQAEQETPMDGGEAKEGGRARICDFFSSKHWFPSCWVIKWRGMMEVIVNISTWEWFGFSFPFRPFRDLCWHVIETEWKWTPVNSQ